MHEENIACMHKEVLAWGWFVVQTIFFFTLRTINEMELFKNKIKHGLTLEYSSNAAGMLHKT